MRAAGKNKNESGGWRVLASRKKSINLCSLSWLQAKKQKNNQPVSRVVCLCKWGKTTINLRSCRKHEKTQQQSTDTACRGRNKKKHNKVKQQSSCVAACHGHKQEKTQPSMQRPVTAAKEEKTIKTVQPLAAASKKNNNLTAIGKTTIDLCSRPQTC